MNSVKGSEALRQSLGLTMADNQVTAILLDAGAWLAVPQSPEVLGRMGLRMHIDTLITRGGKVKVEAESLRSYGVPRADVIPGIEVVSREEIASEIAEAGAVISF